MYKEAKRPKTQGTINTFFHAVNERPLASPTTSTAESCDEREPASLAVAVQEQTFFIPEGRNRIDEGPHQPRTVSFPATNGRRFSDHWYNQFHWLEYYADVDKAFCFPCRLFKNEAVGCAEKAYTENGFQTWKKGPEKFRAHEASETHKTSVQKLQYYKLSLKSGSVASQVISLRNIQVEENKKYLQAICESLLYCARQGIGLRGHDEREDSANRGNFLELLKLRSKDSAVIKKCFSDKEKYFSYNSKEVQNELLQLMSEQALKQILKKIKRSSFYSVLVDETTDISHYEQVAIVVRYVDPVSLTTHESFLGFFRTGNTDGESLAALIKKALSEFELPISNIRAQCYDGAANMRGAYKGVAARILQENHLAYYVHCYAHVLNLCIVDACSHVVPIRNAMGILKELHNFLNGSAKRNFIYQENLKNKQFFGGKTSLKSLSDTRWNCRVEACNTVLQNFDEILATLQFISETDIKSSSQAESLLNNIENFQFIFCILLIQRILNTTNNLSKLLQSESVNYNTVRELADATKECLSNFRNEEFFEKLWSYVQEICSSKSYDAPKLPRSRRVPSKLDGGLISVSSDVKSYFRNEVTYPTLDTALNTINEKFNENDIEIFQALNEIVCTYPLSSIKDSSIKNVCDTYNISDQELRSELLIFCKMYKKHKSNTDSEDKSDQRTEFRRRCDFFAERELRDIKPCLNQIFEILLVIPVSTASCERSFSCLRLLKSHLRSTMGQYRLSSIALLKIENDIPIYKIVEQFSFLKKRRLHFH